MDYPVELNFKKIALARQATLTDASGNSIAYARQKIFKLKEELGDAPLLEWQYRDSPPKFSAWRRKVVTDYVVEHFKDLEGLVSEGHFYNYGHWSFNGGFKYCREWRFEPEPEEIGSCD